MAEGFRTQVGVEALEKLSTTVAIPAIEQDPSYFKSHFIFL